MISWDFFSVANNLGDSVAFNLESDSLKRLEHEYSLREELDSRWAARPIATARHWGSAVAYVTSPDPDSTSRSERKPEVGSSDWEWRQITMQGGIPQSRCLQRSARGLVALNLVADHSGLFAKGIRRRWGASRLCRIDA